MCFVVVVPQQKPISEKWNDCCDVRCDVKHEEKKFIRQWCFLSFCIRARIFSHTTTTTTTTAAQQSHTEVSLSSGRSSPSKSYHRSRRHRSSCSFSSCRKVPGEKEKERVRQKKHWIQKEFVRQTDWLREEYIKCVRKRKCEMDVVWPDG